MAAVVDGGDGERVGLVGREPRDRHPGARDLAERAAVAEHAVADDAPAPAFARSHASVTAVAVTSTARRPAGGCGASFADAVLIAAAAERRPRASTARTDRRCGAPGRTPTVARVPRTRRSGRPSR